MRTRVACCSLLYRKSLRLSQASLAETASGQVINLMSNDVRFFDSSLLFVPYIVIAPIQTAVIVYLLYRIIGKLDKHIYLYINNITIYPNFTI